jgi:hypothetical protein
MIHCAHPQRFVQVAIDFSESDGLHRSWLGVFMSGILATAFCSV